MRNFLRTTTASVKVVPFVVLQVAFSVLTNAFLLRDRPTWIPAWCLWCTLLLTRPDPARSRPQRLVTAGIREPISTLAPGSRSHRQRNPLSLDDRQLYEGSTTDPAADAGVRLLILGATGGTHAPLVVNWLNKPSRLATRSPPSFAILRNWRMLRRIAGSIRETSRIEHQ